MGTWVPKISAGSVPTRVLVPNELLIGGNRAETPHSRNRIRSLTYLFHIALSNIMATRIRPVRLVRLVYLLSAIPRLLPVSCLSVACRLSLVSCLWSVACLLGIYGTRYLWYTVSAWYEDNRY